MNEIQRRKTFQRVKSLTHEQFWQWMNEIHSQAYFLGQKHVREAMSCQPRISTSMIEQVMAKADEIRESWDGIPMLDVKETITEMVTKGGKADDRTASD